MKAKVLPTEVSIWVLTFFPESSRGLGLGTCPALPLETCWLWEDSYPLTCIIFKMGI